MLVGYVSNERYVALHDVAAEFRRGEEIVAICRTSASGAILADIPPGEYDLILSKDGVGSKTVRVFAESGKVHQFRLMTDRLTGYVWPKWAKSGEPGEFRVHSVKPYRLSLWRYGIEKEFICLVGWFDEHGPRATMQFLPDGDFTQSGVQWNRTGYGSTHHGQTLPAPERSGLYYFHAETEDGETFAFPWIVAPARPAAKLAVISNSITTNAYNNFGGRSNYVNAAGLPDRPTINARQDLFRYAGGTFNEWSRPNEAYLPLSFDRPEPANDLSLKTEASDPIRGRDSCHVSPAEWRLLAWMEREGIAYDFYSEMQLHEGTLDLSAYKVLVTGPHPEYWTEAMYLRVKRWVFEQGGKLMYLGGNGLNCMTEILPNGSALYLTHLNSPDGALGMADPRDPSRILESRMHLALESEANLLGVVCTETGIMTAAPYRVVDDSHWAFDGCRLRNGDLFGANSLQERVPGGASGHETDKRSPFSPPGTTLLAKGVNPDDGGAEMVHFTTAGGGEVFSVGSITYIASLLVDERVSRITRNVAERFLG